jgi:hypothetical protein
VGTLGLGTLLKHVVTKVQGRWMGDVGGADGCVEVE